MLFFYLALQLSAPSFAQADSCPEQKPVLSVNGKDVLPMIEKANQDLYSSSVRFKRAIPPFLRSKIGDGPGQISKVVLKRARALFLRDRFERKSQNLCYVAMDASRPHLLNEAETDKGGEMKLGDRLYLICETLGIFKAMPVAHGGGVDLRKQNSRLDLKNSRYCARYFGNVAGGFFTMGGNYLTGALKYSYKGKVLQKDGSYCDYSRPFLSFSGEGETANAEEREIGAHPVITMGKGAEHCDWSNPHHDDQGYVFYSEGLANYNGGRTEGCLGMPEADAAAVLSVARDHPMSVYVYPQKQDILDRAKPNSKTYWNAECLKAIGSPIYFGEGESKDLEDALTLKKDQEKLAAKETRPDCPKDSNADFPNDLPGVR